MKCTEGSCKNPAATTYDAPALSKYSNDKKCVFPKSGPLNVNYDGTDPEDDFPQVYVDGSADQKEFLCKIRLEMPRSLAIDGHAGMPTLQNVADWGGTCVCISECKRQVVPRGVTASGGRRLLAEENEMEQNESVTGAIGWTSSRRRLVTTAIIDVTLVPPAGSSAGAAAAMQQNLANILATNNPTYGTSTPLPIEIGGCMTVGAMNYNSAATNDDESCVWSIDVPEVAAGKAIHFASVSGTSAIVWWA
jgi:hypothetical protein